MIPLSKVARILRQRGILGINARNANFIRLYNARRFYPIVDDKLKTKELALANNIPVPELYTVVDQYGQVSSFGELVGGRSEFVIKPAAGSGGQGVLVIAGRIEDYYRTPNGLPISTDDVRYHLINTLSGMFSLGGRHDKAIVEYRVISASAFDEISSGGVPDVRIIVFMGIPVMAMVRLPTRMSDGKANLHQGAIGAGVEIATGSTTTGVWQNRRIVRHPDTLQPIDGVQIPYWSELLTIAAGCWELTGLGYLGVDLVIDAHRGPLLLELNARPGLSIQIANDRGLCPRLRQVGKLREHGLTVEQRVEFSRKELL